MSKPVEEMTLEELANAVDTLNNYINDLEQKLAQYKQLRANITEKVQEKLGGVFSLPSHDRADTEKDKTPGQVLKASNDGNSWVGGAGRKPKLSPNQMYEAQQMLDRGVGISDVAAKFKIGFQTISSYIDKQFLYHKKPQN